jgi:hypothetical protein
VISPFFEVNLQAIFRHCFWMGDQFTLLINKNLVMGLSTLVGGISAKYPYPNHCRGAISVATASGTLF